MGEQIELGDVVRDVVTGYTGRVTAKAIYMYSTPQARVEGKLETNDSEDSGRWFELARLEVVASA